MAQKRKRFPDDVAALKTIISVCESNDGLCCDNARERKILAEAILAELKLKFLLIDKPSK